MAPEVVSLPVEVENSSSLVATAASFASRLTDKDKSIVGLDLGGRVFHINEDMVDLPEPETDESRRLAGDRSSDADADSSILLPMARQACTCLKDVSRVAVGIDWRLLHL